jgi:hypothetical protein
MKKVVALAVIWMGLIAIAGCSDSDTKPARGVWDGNRYTSESAHIMFEMPDHWAAATDEELSASMGLRSDALVKAGMKFSKEMLQAKIVYDMMARDEQTGTNVLVLYENLALSTDGEKLSEDEYLKNLQQGLTQTDMGYTFKGTDTQTLSEKTYYVLETQVAPARARQYYYVRKIDPYMLVIIISAVGEDTISQVAGYFS